MQHASRENICISLLFLYAAAAVWSGLVLGGREAQVGPRPTTPGTCPHMRTSGTTDHRCLVDTRGCRSMATNRWGRKIHPEGPCLQQWMPDLGLLPIHKRCSHGWRVCVCFFWHFPRENQTSLGNVSPPFHNLTQGPWKWQEGWRAALIPFFAS